MYSFFKYITTGHNFRVRKGFLIHIKIVATTLFGSVSITIHVADVPYSEFVPIADEKMVNSEVP